MGFHMVNPLSQREKMPFLKPPTNRSKGFSSLAYRIIWSPFWGAQKGLGETFKTKNRDLCVIFCCIHKSWRFAELFPEDRKGWNLCRTYPWDASMPQLKTAKTILKGNPAIETGISWGFFGSLIPSNKAVLYIPKWCLYRDDRVLKLPKSPPKCFRHRHCHVRWNQNIQKVSAWKNIGIRTIF